MTYIKHNGQWKRTIGVTIEQGTAISVLTPKEWNNDYKPTITTTRITKKDPSVSASLRFTETATTSPGDGIVSLTWSNAVRGKKARIFYRCLTSAQYGQVAYIYDGNRSNLAAGYSTYGSGCLDVDDLSKLTAFSLDTAVNSAHSWLELYAIELFN